MAFITFWSHLAASVVSLKQIMEHLLFNSNVELGKGMKQSGSHFNSIKSKVDLTETIAAQSDLY